MTKAEASQLLDALADAAENYGYELCAALDGPNAEAILEASRVLAQCKADVLSKLFPTD